MSEWWTYRLSDLIPFSPDVYYRTFALYHHRIWPAHAVFVVLVVAAAMACLRSRSDGRPGRILVFLLAACWAWTGMVFHLQSYATINWAATWFAGGFLLQAGLLGWLGVRRLVPVNAADARRVVLWFAMLSVAAPIAGLAAERQWDQVEFLGLTPDPTAVATIAMLRISRLRGSWIGLAVPLVWCVVGGLTLEALGSREAWWTWVSAAAAFLGTRRPT